jgi:hypothetical protein
MRKRTGDTTSPSIGQASRCLGKQGFDDILSQSPIIIDFI